MKKVKAILAPLFLSFLSLHLFCTSLNADDWLQPSTQDYFSENRNYVVQVIPAKDTGKPSATVFSVASGNRKKLWQTSLVNARAPHVVLLSDDGNSLVTFDDWAGVGYGTNVVAIYGKQGLLKNYSLEDFAPEPKEDRRKSISTQMQTNADGTISITGHIRDIPGYRGRFSHTTSSRWWNNNNLVFFNKEANGLILCLWLDWDLRWVAWQMSDGKLVKVTKQQTERWNATGRQLAHKNAQTPEPSMVSLNFLGRLKNPSDRQYVEKQLRDTTFHIASSDSTDSETKISKFQLFSYSGRRLSADFILARWDGSWPNTSSLSHAHESTRLLGTVETSVVFPVGLKKEEGVIRAYLIPASTPLEKWSQATPEHYLVAHLRSHRPFDFRDGKIQPLPLGEQLNLSIQTVTPGDYRLKVIWFRKESAEQTATILKQPASGDYETIDSPLITVRAGQTVKDIQLKSMSPVK
jgi:hypothetical protein